MGATQELTEPTRYPRVDERMDEAIASAVAGDPRYPDGTAFVPASMPGAADALDRHLALGRPVVLVYDDGHERLVRGARRSDELERVMRAYVDAARRLIGR